MHTTAMGSVLSAIGWIRKVDRQVINMAITSVTSSISTTTGYRQLPASSGGLAVTANGSMVYTGDGKSQKEKSTLSDAVEQLDKSLRVFKRDAVLDDLFLDGNDSSSFYDMVSQSTRTLVSSYNKLNDVLRSSNRISKEGSMLLILLRKKLLVIISTPLLICLSKSFSYFPCIFPA
ncbi:MAG: hypothetical protein K0Q75_2872 [Anaerospora sp.]|nr:hypothetical protein [Anaerospora sp.]